MELAVLQSSTTVSDRRRMHKLAVLWMVGRERSAFNDRSIDYRPELFPDEAGLV